MKSEILKELYESIETVNKLCLNDELTLEAKAILVREEETKQKNLRAFLEELNYE